MTQARGVSRDTKRQRGSALPVVDVTPSPGVPPMPPLVGGAPVEAVAVPPVHAPPTGLALADKMVKDLEAALARKVDAAIGSKASARELIQLHRYWSEIRSSGTVPPPPAPAPKEKTAKAAKEPEPAPPSVDHPALDLFAPNRPDPAAHGAGGTP